MGAQQWVNSAKRYLEVSNKGVKASELRKMSEDKDREIHSLKHTIDLMKTELDHLREQVGGAVTMNDVQRLLANQGGGGKRGVFAPGNLPASFDAQASQINNTHATRDLRRPMKRARARIT